MPEFGAVSSAISRGDPAWLGGSEPYGTFEIVGIAIVLVPAIWIPAKLGARYGASKAFTSVGACWRAFAWSVPCAWTFVVCAGHGVGILPLPAWLALVAQPHCSIFPSPWVPMALAVVFFLTLAIQNRGRATGAPWA